MAGGIAKGALELELGCQCGVGAQYDGENESRMNVIKGLIKCVCCGDVLAGEGAWS